MGRQRPVDAHTESALDLDLVYPCVYDILLQNALNDRQCSNVPLRFWTEFWIDRHKHKHSSSLSVVFLTVLSPVVFEKRTTFTKHFRDSRGLFNGGPSITRAITDGRYRGELVDDMEPPPHPLSRFSTVSSTGWSSRRIGRFIE